jgi:hypothetical protein
MAQMLSLLFVMFQRWVWELMECSFCAKVSCEGQRTEGPLTRKCVVTVLRAEEGVLRPAWETEGMTLPSGSCFSTFK